MAAWCEITYDFKWPGIVSTTNFLNGVVINVLRWTGSAGDGDMANRANYISVPMTIYRGPTYVEIVDANMPEIRIDLNYGNFNELVNRMMLCSYVRSGRGGWFIAVNDDCTEEYIVNTAQCFEEDELIYELLGDTIPSSVDLLVRIDTIADGITVGTKYRKYTFEVCDESWIGTGSDGCANFPPCPCPPKLQMTCCDHVPKDYVLWLDELYGDIIQETENVS